MINLVKSEMYRLFHTKSFWILNIVLLIVALIAPNLSASVNETHVSAGSGTTGAMGFLDSMGNTMFYLIVVTSFIASYICAGFEQRTVQDSVAAGGGRGKILLSKTLCIYVAAFIMLLVYSVTYMFAVVLLKHGGFGMDGNIISRMALSFFAVFIQQIAQITLIILIAFALKKASIVIAIGISFFTVGMLLLSASAFRFEWLGKLLEFTPFFGKSSITSGFTAPMGDYMQTIILGVIWIIALLGMTYSIFKKAELR
ncbi:MAG: ABC transporter permease subunit [Christensenellaceae bacterium]